MPADLYSALLRPLLFRLPADWSHDLARLALRWPVAWRLLAGRWRPDSSLRTELAGIPLASPIGLAPGFDKNGDLLTSLGQLGFGYLVVGSITKEPRKGNPLPRLLRDPGRRSISNSMGLPNQGLRVAVEYLRRAPKSPPVIASVAGFSGSELVDCALAVEPHAAAVEIGLVCPNTTDTERLEELRIFHALVEELSRRKSKPVFIKLPPHHDGVQRHHVVAMVDACLQAGIDGLSLSGTRSVSEPRLAMGKGSLAGRPVFLDTLRIVGDLAERAGGRLAIKAAGGVFTGGDARQILDAGADAVEVYSSFIYRGWDVARRIAAELAELGSLPQRSPNRLGRDRDAVQSGTVGR